MAITVTLEASEHIKKYLNDRERGIGIRLGVKTSGCSGLAYKLEVVDQVMPNDLVFESYGVKIFIDQKDLAFLDGTVLDYVKEELKEGFKFENPNVKAECGCGESFTV